MNLEQLADLGEFVGGVAVLVTLVYLAVQIRGGRAEAQAANNQAQADAHASYLVAVACDPVLSRTFSKVLWAEQGEALSSEEEERLFPLMHAAFTQFQVGFYSFEKGYIQVGFEHHLGSALGGWTRSPHVQRWWGEQRDVFAPEFRARVDAMIAAGGEGAR